MSSRFLTLFRSACSIACLSLLFCASSRADTVTVMPIGDSITAGTNGSPSDLRGSYRYELGLLLGQAGIDVDFVGEFKRGLGDNDHQGVSGAPISAMVDNFGPAIAIHQPDYALVLAGTNNHFQGPDDEFFVENYTNLINTIRDNSPNTSIIISTVPKFGYDRIPETAYWTNEFVDFRNSETFPSMNRAIRQVANQFNDVAVVDFYAELDIQQDLVPDAVHPNLYGHQKLANLFYGELSSQISAVPEPASAVGLLVLSAGVLSRRRRR